MNRGDAAREALGRVLRDLRRSRGISQDALARASEAGRTFIGSVDRGERNPSFEHLLRTLRALGVTWGELGAALDAEPATRVAPIPAEAHAAGRAARRRVRTPRVPSGGPSSS